MKSFVIGIFLLLIGLFLLAGILNKPAVAPAVESRLDDPQLVFAYINEFRETKSLGPLIWAENLCLFAKIRVEQVKIDWSHNGFRNYSSKFDEFCYKCVNMGENLASGFDDGRDVVDAWINSPTHLANLVAPWTHACVAVDSQGGYSVLEVARY